MSAPPPSMAKLPTRVSEPSRLMEWLETVPDAVLTANRYLPSWLISTQHGAVCPSA